MLEHALAELFEEQASENPPPTHASVIAATREGRTRRRHRAVISITAPVLAAAAVLAIALTGVLAGPAPVAPAQHGGPGHALPARILRLTAMPGWLPSGAALKAVVVTPHASYLSIFGRGGEQQVSLYRRGWCSLRASKLTCPNDNPTVTASPFVLTLTGPAPAIDGRAAYWGRPDGGTNQTDEAFLIAPGNWVVATFPSRADDTAVIQHLIIGRTVPPVRYLAQLTGTWPGLGLLYLTASYSRGMLAAGQWVLGAPGFPVSFPPVQISVSRAVPGYCNGATGGMRSVINGIQVTIWPQPAGESHGVRSPAGQTLCAAAAGQDIQIDVYRTYPGVTAASIFAHLRLFGSDPANWSTRPIG
jgi:hypothetical protein